MSPVAYTIEMAENMERFNLDIEAHIINRGNLDNNIFTNTGHSLGNRTKIADYFAAKYLLPQSPLLMRRQGRTDFEIRDKSVKYQTSNGFYVISYKHGFPTGYFEKTQ